MPNQYPGPHSQAQIKSHGAHYTYIYTHTKGHRIFFAPYEIFEWLMCSVFVLFCRICLFWLKVFSSFHCSDSFVFLLAFGVMLLFCFWYHFQRICWLLFLNYVFFFCNFTFLDAYCLDCPSFSLFVSFVPSYLPGLFLFVVLLFVAFWSFSRF